MNEKAVSSNKEKNHVVIISVIILVILMLDSNGFSLQSLGEVLGHLLATLFLGIIVGNIYFALKRKERTIWQRYRVIVVITLVAVLWTTIPSMISNFSEGYQQGYQRQSQNIRTQ